MSEVQANITKYFRRTLLWIILLVATLFLIDAAIKLLAMVELEYVKKFSSLLLSYENYVLSVPFLIMGYKAVMSFSGFVYWSGRKVADHATAYSLRIVTRILGIAVLLSVLASVFNLNPSAALTLGSFTGLVVGFATQTVLNHAVAGIFLILLKPFRVGDYVEIGGNKGVVEDITIMHTVIRTEDGERVVMIPSGSIVSSTIIKRIQK